MIPPANPLENFANNLARDIILINRYRDRPDATVVAKIESIKVSGVSAEGEAAPISTFECKLMFPMETYDEKTYKRRFLTALQTAVTKHLTPRPEAFELRYNVKIFSPDECRHTISSGIVLSQGSL